MGLEGSLARRAGVARGGGLRDAIDDRLAALAPARGASRLTEAMRYGLLAPGKRVRPMLCVLTATQFGGDPARALDPACAVEMVHAASLLLDDLPAMDDAQLRRGRPSTHVAYGEDLAILAAVALLNLAYGVTARAEGVEPAARLEAVGLLSRAVGLDGLVAGQERDLRERDAGQGVGAVEELNHLKTGVLFVAAAEIGARVAGVADGRLEPLREFAGRLGLAFQILDDVLDAEGDEAVTGKSAGRDGEKPTVLSLVGGERVHDEAGARVSEALRALDACAPGGGPLRSYVEGMFGRVLGRRGGG